MCHLLWMSCHKEAAYILRCTKRLVIVGCVNPASCHPRPPTQLRAIFWGHFCTCCIPGRGSLRLQKSESRPTRRDAAYHKHSVPLSSAQRISSSKNRLFMAASETDPTVENLSSAFHFESGKFVAFWDDWWMHDKLGNCNCFCSKMAFEMPKSV